MIVGKSGAVCIEMKWRAALTGCDVGELFGIYITIKGAMAVMCHIHIIVDFRAAQ